MLHIFVETIFWWIESKKSHLFDMIGNIMNIFYCHFYINLIYSFMKKRK